MKWRAALLAGLTCLASLSGFADEGEFVRARLVTDAGRLDAVEIRLGVLLEMAPDWHVYWINPGDAGLATELGLTLPEGWSAGPIQWPAPAGFASPGGIQSYGYGDKVLLTAPVRRTGASRETVRASVSWLACKDRCVLGGAELELALPVTAAEAAAGRALLDRWQGRLPVDARLESPPFTVRTIGGLDSGAGRAPLSIWLGWREDPGAVELYPAPPEGFTLKNVTVRTRGQLTRVDGELTRLGARSLPASFPAVVVRRDGAGEGRAWLVDIPLSR